MTKAVVCNVCFAKSETSCYTNDFLMNEMKAHLLLMLFIVLQLSSFLGPLSARLLTTLLNLLSRRQFINSNTSCAP